MPPDPPPLSPGRIQLLDPLLANQIAAGEVVERPASVVKELVENALDAGATRVEVELDDGGRARIEVRDDGHGIEPDDAALAFARHATSKIKSAEELARVQSYGFRGEALASIGAVGRCTLESRRRGADVGVRVELEGSAQPQVRPVHCAPGTRIIVRDLFFNTPARQAFLRGAATELGHVMRLLEGLALARPSLHVLLRAGGRSVLDLPARATLALRAADVFGAEVAADLYPIALDGPYAVSGLLSRPATHRGTPSVCLVIDGRAVQERTLGVAIAAAYGERLERGRHPIGVVHLRAPLGAVDVNVHPTKAEVRFASSRAVHAAIGDAVRAMLDAAPWEVPAPHQAGLALRVASPSSRRSGASTASPGAASQAPLLAIAPAARSSPRRQGGPDTPTITRASAAGAREAPAEAGFAMHGSAAAALAASPPSPGGQGLDTRRCLGLVAGSWLAFATDTGVALIDVHAADERALAARLSASARGGPLAIARPLVPPIVTPEAGARDRLLAAAPLLLAIGVELEPAGSQALLLRSLPREVPATRSHAVAARVAAALAEVLASDDTSPRALIAAIACAAAWHEALPPPDAAFVEALVASSAGVDLRAVCPHGRRARVDLDAAAIGALASR